MSRQNAITFHRLDMEEIISWCTDLSFCCSVKDVISVIRLALIIYQRAKARLTPQIPNDIFCLPKVNLLK